jgi:predicted enzyme related to lactoylglutathione lyase
MGLKPGTATIDRAHPRPVPEPRAGIDLHAEHRDAEVEHLVALGATVLDEQEVPGLRWTVRADPEGNEFCVAG